MESKMTIIDGVGDEVVGATILMLVIFIITFLLYARNFSLNVPSLFHWASLEAQVPLSEQQPNIPSSNDPSTVDATLQTPSESENVDEHEATKEKPISVTGEVIEGVQLPGSGEAEHISKCENDPAHESFSDSSSVENIQEQSNIPTSVSDEVNNGSNGMHETATQENSSEPLNAIKVRLKYLNDTERIVSSICTEKVKDFKRLHFSEDISNNKIVRLIYNGQLLRDNLTLSECGITEGTVVHVHVSLAPSPQVLAADSNTNLDLSNLLWPLFALVLGASWMSCIHYPEYFNVPSIVLLVVFTVSFLITFLHPPVQAA